MSVIKLAEDYLANNDLAAIIPRATKVFNYLITADNAALEPLIKHLNIWEINYTLLFKNHKRELFKKIIEYFNLTATDLLLILKRGGHLAAARSFNYELYCG